MKRPSTSRGSFLFNTLKLSLDTPHAFCSQTISPCRYTSCECHHSHPLVDINTPQTRKENLISFSVTSLVDFSLLLFVGANIFGIFAPERIALEYVSDVGRRDFLISITR